MGTSCGFPFLGNGARTNGNSDTPSREILFLLQSYSRVREQGAIHVFVAQNGLFHCTISNASKNITLWKFSDVHIFMKLKNFVTYLQNEPVLIGLSLDKIENFSICHKMLLTFDAAISREEHIVLSWNLRTTVLINRPICRSNLKWRQHHLISHYISIP